MPYQIYETETFSKLYEAMEKVGQVWVNKIKQQLIENPPTGKPLRFDWFREKKFADIVSDYSALNIYEEYKYRFFDKAISDTY